jgi:hypothetical protein
MEAVFLSETNWTTGRHTPEVSNLQLLHGFLNVFILRCFTCRKHRVFVDACQIRACFEVALGPMKDQHKIPVTVHTVSGKSRLMLHFTIAYFI